MKSPISLSLSFAVVFVSGASFTAAPARNLPVISTLVGTGPADLIHTLQSDGAGPYLHNVKGGSGVESHIQESGAYELDVYYFTSSRRLYFDFRNIVPGTESASAPRDTVIAPGRLITKCDSTTNLLNMDPSAPLDSCALHGRFAYNGRTMLVRMDAAAFTGTTNVRVTCTGTDPANSSQCHHWKLQTCSGLDAGGNCSQWGYANETLDMTANVLTILEEKSTKGKVTTAKVAEYYMQFEIYASKQ